MNCSILVVDDDAGILETMKDILVEMNFKITTTDNGYKALDLVLSGKFDAVLMDIRMPGIDGIETLKRIKHFKPTAKVILMTAYTSNGMILEARKEGAVEILYKPLDINHLEVLLRSCLKDRSDTV